MTPNTSRAPSLLAPSSGDLFPAAERPELVSTVHGQPMTTSRRVAQMFGKEHKNVLRSIERLLGDLPEEFGRLNFELATYLDEVNHPRPEYLLTQDGFLALAMGFTGKEAARWRASFITAFNPLARALQRQQRQRLSADWQAARAAVAQQHSSVTAVLVEVRKAVGKATEAHHMANEARLIGYAMTGVFAGLDRQTLDAQQLRLLHRVECHDVILLVQGVAFEERKARLRALVQQDASEQGGHA